MKDNLEFLRQMSTGRPGDAAPGTKVMPISPATDEEECETTSFGYLRGVQDRALNIEFRRTVDGDEVSFPYALLAVSRHNPSLGIQMLFTGPELYLVILRGRNLNTVFKGMSLYDRGLLRQRVTFVREATREESRLLPETTCVVEKIEIQVVTEEEAAKAFAFANASGKK
jgi:hypothetical protein